MRLLRSLNMTSKIVVLTAMEDTEVADTWIKTTLRVTFSLVALRLSRRVDLPCMLRGMRNVQQSQDVVGLEVWYDLAICQARGSVDQLFEVGIYQQTGWPSDGEPA
jgi:hypothetical protein